MATHDYNLANQDGASFRSDLNNALAAIVSNNSSSTAPATTFAHQIWVDTTANVIKQRNAANDAWIELWRIDGGFNAKTFSSNVTLNAQSDLRFADSDSSNWVAFQAPATVASNVTWTLPSADGTSGQALTTNGSGTLSWSSASADTITEGNTSAEVVDTGSDGHFKVITEGTEAIRVDSSQRLLVGTSSDITGSGESVIQGVHVSGGTVDLGRNDTTVGSGDPIGQIRFWGNDSNGTYQECARIGALSETPHETGDKPTRLSFFTTKDGESSPTERVRITQAGTFRFFSSDGSGIRIIDDAAGSATNTLISGSHSGTSTQSEGTVSFIVRTNGNVLNTNDSYGAISDIKLKENIVDAESQWDDFKAVRFRKYNFKEETGHETFTQLGVIAQELELVSPGLVTETPDLDEEGNDLGTTTKSVKYSILTKKALVALQEAMERIETLETANASLEARLTALEGGA